MIILSRIAPSTSTSVISDNLLVSIGLVVALFVVVLGVGAGWGRGC